MNGEKTIVSCPQCAKRMGVPKRDAELQVTCPHCGHTFQLLMAEPVESEASSASAVAHAAKGSTASSSAPTAAAASASSNADPLFVVVLLAFAVLGVFAGSSMKPVDGFDELLIGYLLLVVLGFVLTLALFVALMPFEFVLRKLGLNALVNVLSSVAMGTGVGVALCLAIGLSIAYFAADSEWRGKPYAWLQENYPAVPQTIITARMWADEAFGNEPQTQAQNTSTAEPPPRATPPSKSTAQATDAPRAKPAQPMASDASARSTPATAPVSDVERDARMLGLTDAWKAEQYERVLDYAAQLQSMGNVPPTVHYFSAEAHQKLRRHGYALEQANAYLALGNTARYYEQALRVRVTANEGLTQDRAAWKTHLNALVGRIQGDLKFDTSWSFTSVVQNGRVLGKNERPSADWGEAREYNFRCYFRAAYGSYETRVHADAFEIIHKRDGQSKEESSCFDRFRREGADAAIPSMGHFPTSGLIPFTRVGELKLNGHYLDCKSSRGACPPSSLRYETMTVPGYGEALIGTKGYLDRGSLEALQDLYQRNGASVWSM